MNKSIVGVAMLFGLLVAHLPVPSSGSEGFSYAATADTVVYGGTYLLSRTRNPEDARTVYAERFDTGARKVVRRFDGSLSDIQASPQGSLVGVLEHFWEEGVGKERATYTSRQYDKEGNLVEFHYFEESRLVVLNLDGVVIDMIRGVRRFAWEPEGRRIAYITGTYTEDGIGFRTTGTWIYDVSSRQSRRIHPGGYDVHWAQWNASVYIYTGYNRDLPDVWVMRFDPTSENLSATSHKGIYFSPDGRYYFRGASEGGVGGDVFETDGDKQVSLDQAFRFADQPRGVLATGWLGRSTLIVRSPLPGGEQTDYLYDIENGTRRHADGKVLATKDDGNHVLIIRGSAVVSRSLSSLAVE